MFEGMHWSAAVVPDAGTTCGSDLRRQFASSGESSAIPDGLVLEVVAGGHSRWTRSADGDWIGIVNWVGRTTVRDSVKVSEQ